MREHLMNTAGNSAVPTPQKRIPNAICRIDDRLESVEKTLASLAEKLHPILSSASPTDEGSGIKEAASCDLQNQLILFADRLQLLQSGLDSLLDRLEI